MRGNGTWICALVLGWAAAAHGVELDRVKSAADGGANWLIEQFDLKTGIFGASEVNKLPGIQGLAIRVLSEHHRKYSEPLGPFMTEPVKYILKQQQEDGSIRIEGQGFDTYNTALALHGLAALKNPKYTDAISKARAYLLTAQSKDGGFTYGYGFRQGGDLSNTWCALSSLKAAGEKDAKVFEAALNFIRRVQDNIETNPDAEAKAGPNSGGAYYKPGQSEAGTVKNRDGVEFPKPYGSMTAAALDGYLQSGLKADAPEVQAALRWLTANFSATENPGAGMNGYYYYVHALARAFEAAQVTEISLGDGGKVHWADALATQLLARQKREGFWVNETTKWMESDPVLCTAYALGALNICYKQLKAAKK
ncbi:MAG: terpene cyclase/mutase family protein [Planctomycetes bacterium]|nr:terpene cyclase/mutase family protein [Planctomycetota bacterium]